MQPVVKYRRASSLRREWGLRGRWWSGWRGVLSVLAWLGGHGIHLARTLDARLSLLKLATTLLSCAAFLVALPLLLILYTVMKCWRAAVGAWAVRAVEGGEEVGEASVRGAMVGPGSPAGLHTLLVCLAGRPPVAQLRDKIREEVVERVDEEGRLLHPNLRRRLTEVWGGQQVWCRCPHFDLDQHVRQAPDHHCGALITHRTIQDYVSHLASQPLPDHLPPWQVVVVSGSTTGAGGEDEGETWVVARAHHLLASNLSLPDLLTTAYPDPWLMPASRSFTLLAAPAATARLMQSAHGWPRAVAEKLRVAFNELWLKQGKHLLTPILSLFEEATHHVQKLESSDLPQAVTLVRTAAVIGLLLTVRLRHHVTGLLHPFRPSLIVRGAWKAWWWTAAVAARGWWQIAVWTASLPWTLPGWWRWGRRRAVDVWRGEGCQLVVAALVELYWLGRAFVSLPRLLLEEALAARGAAPLLGSVARRRRVRAHSGRWHTLSVAWSDPVPLSTAKGVRGATGASLSEVLFTATAGAVRDYLRVTGLRVPDEVCCTVPVYPRRWAASHNPAPSSGPTPGLVTLSLPTGAADAVTALRQVRQAMNRVRDYPERYLASVWLLRNVAYFLPEPLLGAAFRALSTRYPVLLSNLVGPSQPVALWGHKLLKIFYWRPPLDGAVVSVCVASYRGQAQLGVAVDGSLMPGAATLPQAFVTHLNELAVEAGVRLERQNSHSWFSNCSPPCTPAPSPALKFFPQWGRPRGASCSQSRRHSLPRSTKHPAPA